VGVGLLGVLAPPTVCAATGVGGTNLNYSSAFSKNFRFFDDLFVYDKKLLPLWVKLQINLFYISV